MNQIDFSQPGGFPLDQDVLGFLQNSIFLASQTAALGGAFSIISGCEEVGDSVTSGYVSINGEILPFEGNAKDEKVIIVETITPLSFEDGESREVKKVRIAKFGNDGITNYLWTNFKRNTTEGVLARLERLERISAPFLTITDPNTGIQPRGGIVLWNKPAGLIPDGWAEVEGWEGLMPVGYNAGDTDFNEVGKIGGNKTFTIGKTNLPNTKINVPGGLVSTSGQDFDVTGGQGSGYYRGTVQTDSLGDGTAVKHLNPYRVVMFIEYVGE